MTGLPSSGKTTVSRYLVSLLEERKIPVVWFEGKDLRDIFELYGYGTEELLKLARYTKNLVNVISKKGFVVVVSAVMPVPDMIEILSPDLTILLDCDVEILKNRDEKGLYEKARRGEILLPGVNVHYEKPKSVDLVLKTCDEPFEKTVRKLKEFLKMERVIT